MTNERTPGEFLMFGFTFFGGLLALAGVVTGSTGAALTGLALVGIALASFAWRACGGEATDA
jgi:hypothetical protein